MCKTVRVGLIVALLLACVDNCAAEFERRGYPSNHIVCLETRTGKQLWDMRPTNLALEYAHFEWYTNGRVVAYPYYDGSDRTYSIFLDAQTGKSAAKHARDPKDLICKSAVFWPMPEVKLDNGWQLHDFSPGKSKSLIFRDKEQHETWRIETTRYPDNVRSWKGSVFFHYGMYDKENILYSYRTGAKEPTWTTDFNRFVPDRDSPLTRMIFQIIDGNLYAQSNEHVFCVRPETGELAWHRDLAKDLGLQFRPDFYDGNLNLAVFAKDGDVLIVSFECRIVALDLKANKYLWHLDPATSACCPFPVAHDGKVILTAGRKRKLTKLTGK